jgi:hypothetical protein
VAAIPVTVKESPTTYYDDAFSTGAMLYWTESTTEPNPRKLRRKNLSNGNHVTVSMPMAWEELMIVTSAGVYVAGTSSETGNSTLFRSSL